MTVSATKIIAAVGVLVVAAGGVAGASSGDSGSTPGTPLVVAGASAGDSGSPDTPLVAASSSTGDSGSTPRTALVVDAALARDGRDLVDSRLEAVDAEVRLPRNAREARTSVRYLSELGHRVVVAGPQASAAATATGVAAVEADGLSGALAAAGR